MRAKNFCLVYGDMRLCSRDRQEHVEPEGGQMTERLGDDSREIDM